MSLIILLDNMDVRFDNPVFCQIAGIAMRTNYTTLSFGSIWPYLKLCFGLTDSNLMITENI